MSLIPFSFWKATQAGIVTDGLQLWLDASNNDSYPGTGTTWFDLASNNNNGNINGATFSSTNGGQFDFDGINNSVLVPNSSTLNPSSQVSISIWLSCDNSSGFRSPLMKTTNANWDDGYGVYQNGSGRFYWYVNLWNGAQSVFISTTTFSITNIAGTYDGTNLKIYQNGSLISTGSSYNTPITNSSTTLDIGRGGGGAFHWDGIIAEVLVYNRGLSGTEVLQNYNATKSRFGL